MGGRIGGARSSATGVVARPSPSAEEHLWRRVLQGVIEPGGRESRRRVQQRVERLVGVDRRAKVAHAQVQTLRGRRGCLRRARAARACARTVACRGGLGVGSTSTEENISRLDLNSNKNGVETRREC